MQRHYIQQNILGKLIKSSESSFTELNVKNLTNDHFNFHIKQLLKEGLIEKKSSKYKLTDKGMELAGRLDIDSADLIQQPKVSITLGVFRNDDKEVLILRRNRSQSFGQYAWLDRKWRLGKSIKDEIDSLLLEEAGLVTSEFIFMGATHVIRKKGKILEIDAVLLNFKISNPIGELKVSSKDGENGWFSVSDIRKADSELKLVGFNERLDAYIESRVLLQEFISEEK